MIMESIENYILGRLERGESLDTIMNDIAAAANSANKTHSANDNRKNGTSSLMDQLNRMDEDISRDRSELQETSLPSPTCACPS